MLSCTQLSVETADGKRILCDADAIFSSGKMHAVIGPSGCGKTTLMKAILGMIKRTGIAEFDGEQIHNCDEIAGAIGFAPQFTLAQPNLTVEETFRYALALNVADRHERERRLQSVLETTKLAPHADKLVGSLSGGQTRRVGLGLELTLAPRYLVCDEVTSGLDPNSEDELLGLMRELVEGDGKTIICIIHNLAKLPLFNTITVVSAGNVIFQGSFPELCKYFEIENPLQLYTSMESHPTDFWVQKWQESRDEIYDADPENFCDNNADADANNNAAGDNPKATLSQTEHAGFLSQLFTLLARRFRLLFRDAGYLALTLAITFGFPCIVVLFALDGLPQVQVLPIDEMQMISLSVFEQAIQVQLKNSAVATLATGLVLFQVILLALMGANNGGREIAAERNLYEKERMTGLRPAAYALSKILFTALIAIFQGAWMCVFVKVICKFPGEWLPQIATMSGVCVAMTLICLGFSALMKSPEKASLLSIYLVGFQLPLSGIVLELPKALVWVFRPFINVFWGWSGFFDAMSTSAIYDAYTKMNANAEIFSVNVSLCVLVLHAIGGAILVFIGCMQRRPL